MTIGAVAVVIGLVLRMWGMSQWIMWEMSGLFENIGTVQDGIASISLPRLVEDKPGAKDIAVTKGEIVFERHRLPLRQGQGRHREPVAHGEAGREGRHRRPLGRRQVDAGQPAAALLRPRKRPHPDRRPGYRGGHAGFAARPDRHGHAGHLAAAPLGARQHPLRPARRQRGDGDRGGAARRGARLHRRRSPTRRAARGSTPMSASAA